MHSASIRCIRWSVALFIVGALFMMYSGSVVFWVYEWLGVNGELGAHLLSFIVTVVNSTVFPLGAVLIGAVVVIETLRVRNDAIASAEGDLETE